MLQYRHEQFLGLGSDVEDEDLELAGKTRQNVIVVSSKNVTCQVNIRLDLAIQFVSHVPTHSPTTYLLQGGDGAAVVLRRKGHKVTPSIVGVYLGFGPGPAGDDVESPTFFIFFSSRDVC